jgi:hypothetical protein
VVGYKVSAGDIMTQNQLQPTLQHGEQGVGVRVLGHGKV